jgi:hypothetical protein
MRVIFMPRELFSDVMLDHPWVAKYRLPMVTSYHPAFHYFVTLADVYNHAAEDMPNLWNVETPTEEEASIVGSYLEFKIADQGFYEHYLKEVRSRVLDVDPGYNTISLIKRLNGGWGYVRMSYRDSIVYPYYNSDTKYDNLVDLLDFIESYSGSEIREAWLDWKKTHNISNGTHRFSADEVAK